jgi:hypothetical protein
MALHARYCTPLEAPPADFSSTYVDLDVMYLYSSEITDMSVSVFRSFIVGCARSKSSSTGRCDGRSVLTTDARTCGWSSDVSAEEMTKHFS